MSTVRGFLASAWPYLVWLVLLVVVVLVFLVAAKSKVLAKTDEEKKAADKMVKDAIDSAESMRLEAQVRKKVASEMATEKLQVLEQVKAEPEPTVRREKLAAMLTSW